MSAKHIHLSYLFLLLLLAGTILTAFHVSAFIAHLSTYLFATSKSLIILFVFMKIKKTGTRSWLFFVLALVMVCILVFFSLDDVLFRDNLLKRDVYGL